MAIELTHVWTFPPNWDDGVLEVLEWLTGVLGSQTGIEQRIGRRQTPRRSFEAGFLVQKRDRRYFDAFISAVGKDPFYLPVWHDIGVTDASAAMGSNFIATDTQFREFANNGLALLRGQHAMEYEVIQIGTVQADGLQLIANTQRLWAKGTRIYPLILATLPSEVSTTKGTDEFIRATIRFNSAQANPYPAMVPPVQYRDFPVINTRPDESEDLTHAYLRLTATLDNETGIPALYDKAGHGFRTQQYRWAVAGRQAHAELRSLFYYLSGKLKAVWLPTFMQDFKLVRPVNPGDTGIFVENVGYSRFNLRLMPGMQDIRIEKRGRTYIYARIVGGVEIDDDMEAISVSIDIDNPLRVEDVLSISFMNLCRLDNDSIEINHPTDAAGVSQAAVITRTSPGIRQADPWTPIPYGDTVKNSLQALCDCLCSDFSIVDDYALWLNGTTDREFLLTPVKTTYSDGWKHIFATENAITFPETGTYTPGTAKEFSVIVSYPTPSQGLPNQTVVRIWGDGTEGYTSVEVFDGAGATGDLPLTYAATPGGPKPGLWTASTDWSGISLVYTSTYSIKIKGGELEPYIPGRDQPPVGAGVDAWLKFYKNWPWVSAPPSAASIQSILDAFPSLSQAEARNVMGAAQSLNLTTAEAAAMTPDSLEYDTFCSNPGSPFPGPLAPRIGPLKEAYVRSQFYSQFKFRYDLTKVQIALTVPPAEGGLLADFCINPASLDYELSHREPGHVTDYRGAGGLLALAAANSTFFYPTDSVFTYPLDQRVKSFSLINAMVPRLASGAINGSIIRARTGGVPLFFFEGHESFQYAAFLECSVDQYPWPGGYGDAFWEEWSWFGMGAMISSTPWPENLTIEVSRIAPYAIIATQSFKCSSRSIPGGKYLNWFLQVFDRQEGITIPGSGGDGDSGPTTQNGFIANPWRGQFSLLPAGNTSYLVRVKAA